MFLCAVSNNNREQYNGADVASVFTTNLTEPLKLKDFTIELVDCVITADNLITITQRNSTFVFRVGGDSVSEQYQATLPTGRYKPVELGNLMIEQLKELTPIAGWVSNDPDANPTFSWSFDYNVFPNADKFVIKYTELPAHSTHISDKIVGKNKDIGYDSVITRAGSGSVCNYVNNFNNNSPNNIPVVQSPEPLNFQGLDVGNNAGTTALTSFNNLGIAESGGAFEVVLKPMLVCKTSSYCSTDLAIATNEVKRMNYFIIEDNTAGTAYDSTTYTDSFLNPRSRTTLRTDKQGKKYCSGLVIDIPAGNDGDDRGLPYNRLETSLIFPTRDDVVFNGTGDLTGNINRIEIITSTWNNNILVASNRHSTTTTNTWNNLEDRAFNLTLDNATGLGSTNAEASSTLQFYDETQPEPITMRLAVEPLIAGLRQGLNTTTQSYITATGGGINQILTPRAGTAGPFSVVYKTGVVGQYNTPFGNPSRHTTNFGGVSERKPYYMITELDGNNVPSKIITMDGGENIVANQKLYLNDPATFDIFVNGVLTDLDPTQAENFINVLCPFIDPSADVIGASVSAYATKYQYMPTELSTINDLIYNSVNVNDGIAFNSGAIFGKDCEFNLIPLDSEQTDPNASINFTIDAFIPNNTDYSSEQNIVSKFQKNNANSIGAIRLIDCNPSDWSGFTIDKPGSSRTLTDWTTFVQNSVASRLKLSIGIDNYYKFSCKVAYSIDSGATFVGDTTILETFETATDTATGVANPKFECTSKSRLYPMHPAISTYPGSGFNDANQGINNITIQNSSLARYSQKVNDLQENISNYSFKLGNIPNGSQNTPSIFTFPNAEADLSPSAGVVDLAKPPIMIKFGSNLSAGTTSFAGVGILPALDIPPAPFQVASETLGFADSYFAETSDYSLANILPIVAPSAPFFKPAINTFVVELANFPAEGYITFGFDRNTNIQSGLGNSSQIVGVVPFLVDRNITTTVNNEFITLQYSTPYSQPVKVELPTEQFLYNFDFRLRDITTGKYVNGLLNPTQLIFRIQKM
jgi:hypothetical protein